MKTTLILNREYKKLRSATNILGDFYYVQFCYCTFGCRVNRKIESDIAQLLRLTIVSAKSNIYSPRRSYLSPLYYAPVKVNSPPQPGP